ARFAVKWRWNRATQTEYESCFIHTRNDPGCPLLATHGSRHEHWRASTTAVGRRHRTHHCIFTLVGLASKSLARKLTSLPPVPNPRPKTLTPARTAGTEHNF
ncbi:unnamed protein product, partial [Ectocarpus sp. 4 AP-2014]